MSTCITLICSMLKAAEHKKPCVHSCTRHVHLLAAQQVAQHACGMHILHNGAFHLERTGYRGAHTAVPGHAPDVDREQPGTAGTCLAAMLCVHGNSGGRANLVTCWSSWVL
jgi:hypothetical protein